MESIIMKNVNVEQFNGAGAYTAVIASARPVTMANAETNEPEAFLRLLVRPGANAELNHIYVKITDASWMKFVAGLMTRNDCATPATWAEVSAETLKPLVGRTAVIDQVRETDDDGNVVENGRVYHRLTAIMQKELVISDPERASVKTPLRSLVGRIELITRGKSTKSGVDQLEAYVSCAGYGPVGTYRCLNGGAFPIAQQMLLEAGIAIDKAEDITDEQLKTLRGKTAIVRRTYSADGQKKFHDLSEIL